MVIINLSFQQLYLITLWIYTNQSIVITRNNSWKHIMLCVIESCTIALRALIYCYIEERVKVKLLFIELPNNYWNLKKKIKYEKQIRNSNQIKIFHGDAFKH